MDFDRESILFDDLGVATSSLPMGVRVVDLALETSIVGDISHHSIAGTVEDVLDARIVTRKTVEVCIMIVLICFCLTFHATN